MNVLITGGASGLGGAITRTLSAELPQSTIYFTYSRSGDAADEICRTLANTRKIACDFSDPNQVKELCNLIAEKDIDILVNNAIVKFSKKHSHKYEEEELSEGFALNILPTVRITSAFIKAARKKKFGKIITILSSVIDNPATGWGSYIAEKMYLYGMHKVWAKENIGFNITSNCVSPDYMHTAFHSDMDERLIEDMITKHPLKKLLTPGEVSQVVLFLCQSPQHLTGENIRISAT